MPPPNNNNNNNNNHKTPKQQQRTAIFRRRRVRYADYALDVGVASAAEDHPGAVPTLSTVCPDSMLGTSWASVLEMCSGAVGEGLMFSLCHDTQLGVEVCSHDTRDDLRRICENSAAAEEHTALGPATSTSFFDHFPIIFRSLWTSSRASLPPGIWQA